jgi:exosortase/archaeosortase family protein
MKAPEWQGHAGIPAQGALAIPRGIFYAGLFAIGFANGLSEKISHQLDARRLGEALFHTFEISVIVWAAIAIGLAWLVCAAPQPIRRSDLVVAACAAAAFLIPVPALSLVAIAAMGCHLAWTEAAPEPIRRAARLLLATTVPLLWTRLLFATTASIILPYDARLVGWLIGSRTSGNAVEFADGSGFLFFAPDCSSFANVSMAVLCLVLFVEFNRREWSWRMLRFGVLASLATIGVNVARISLIGLYPERYSHIHGEVGSTLAGWLNTAAILVICAGAARSHDPASV